MWIKNKSILKKIQTILKQKSDRIVFLNFGIIKMNVVL